MVCKSEKRSVSTLIINGQKFEIWVFKNLRHNSNSNFYHYWIVNVRVRSSSVYNLLNKSQNWDLKPKQLTQSKSTRSRSTQPKTCHFLTSKINNKSPISSATLYEQVKFFVAPSQLGPTPKRLHRPLIKKKRKNLLYIYWSSCTLFHPSTTLNTN